MPGNWDGVQILKEDGGVEWPKGNTDIEALDLPATFNPWRVEAWVIQGVPTGTAGAGAAISFEGPSQSTSNSSFLSNWGPRDRWTAGTPGWRLGSFEAGPAIGVAFVVSRSTVGPPSNQFNWWWDVFELRLEKNEDATMDQNFIDLFKKHTDFLEKQVSAKAPGQFSEAIAKARGRIEEMHPGKSMKDVFGPVSP